MSSPEPDPEDRREPVVKEYDGGRFELITLNNLADTIRQLDKRSKPKTRLEEAMEFVKEYKLKPDESREFGLFIHSDKEKKNRPLKELWEEFKRES